MILGSLKEASRDLCRSGIMELYFYAPPRLHGMVLN
jgi:hypothetical protein